MGFSKLLHAWEFAKTHLIDSENGEWFWRVYDDYSPMREEDKRGFWKCPFYNSRACMEIIKRCKDLTPISA